MRRPRVPDAPAGAGADPATQSGTRATVAALDLAPGVSAADLLELGGANLTTLPAVVDGYSRTVQE